MNSHPYLRAYLAGTFIPTLVLPLWLIAFIISRIVLHAQVPIEQAMIFPMAVVPALFGLWNMLWLATHTRIGQPIGLHGALLPFVLMPAGATTAICLGALTLSANSATWFQAITIPYTLLAPCFLAAVAGYYLVWKYIIGFLNRVVGIA
jgi:hypothetical protein